MSKKPTYKFAIILKKVMRLVTTIALLFVLWLLIRVFICDTFIIPSDSMFPTLVSGDYVIVNKTIMGARIYKDFHFNKDGVNLNSFRLKGLRSIKRNDIVIFNMPNNNGRIQFIINYVYCKRCIGIPGDSIGICQACYYNNNYDGVLGILERQETLASIPDSVIPGYVMHTMPYDYHFPWTIKNFGPLYIPRKNDLIRITPQTAILYKMILEWETRKKITIDWRNGVVQAGGKVIKRHRFKHNYYFMAGDNVANSCDSRYWGLVPEEYIIGVVTKIVFSKNKTINKVRWNRILQSIK